MAVFYVNAYQSGSSMYFSPNTISGMVYNDYLLIRNMSNSRLTISAQDPFNWQDTDAAHFYIEPGSYSLGDLRVQYTSFIFSAVILGSTGGYSNSLRVDITIPAPIAPSLLYTPVFNKTTGEIFFDWAQPRNTTSYNIDIQYMYNDADTVWIDARNETIGVVSSNYTWTGMSPRKRRYRLRAVGPGGTSSYSVWSNSVSNILGKTISKPNVETTNSFFTFMSWSPVTNANRYYVYVSYAPIGGQFTAPTFYQSTDSTSMLLPTTSDGTRIYSYYAYNTSTQEQSEFSPESNSLFRATDNVPESFNGSLGANVSLALPSLSYTSSEFTVQGMNRGVTATASIIESNGTNATVLLYVNGVNEGTADYLYAGQKAKLVMVSPSEFGAYAVYRLNINGVYDTVRITNKLANLDPLPFSLGSNVTGAGYGQVYTSVFQIQGIDAPVNISVTNAVYKINSNPYTTGDSLVNNGDTITVKITAFSTGGTEKICTVTVHNTSRTRSVTAVNYRYISATSIVSLSTIKSFFGGRGTLTHYYRGGLYVPNISPNSNIPTSGTIKLTDFLNSAKNGLASS